MPTERSGDRHASPRRAYQLDDDRWKRLDDDSKAIGESRASVMTWLAEWWLGDRPEPPPRPGR